MKEKTTRQVLDSYLTSAQTSSFSDVVLRNFPSELERAFMHFCSNRVFSEMYSYRMLDLDKGEITDGKRLKNLGVIAERAYHILTGNNSKMTRYLAIIPAEEKKYYVFHKKMDVVILLDFSQTNKSAN